MPVVKYIRDEIISNNFGHVSM